MTSRTLQLTIEPLTAEIFKPFGDVIEANESKAHCSINGGFAERFHDLMWVDTAEDGGHPIVSIFKALPRTFPMSLSVMERHTLGSQAFMPLGTMPFLVVVAESGPAPKVQDLRCFMVASGQGVNYARGTWHHPLIALEVPSTFLVIDRGGPSSQSDCEVITLETDGLIPVR